MHSRDRQETRINTYLTLEGLGNFVDCLGNLNVIIARLDQPKSSFTGQMGSHDSISLFTSYLGLEK